VRHQVEEGAGQAEQAGIPTPAVAGRVKKSKRAVEQQVIGDRREVVHKH
jgi:hypothetical protein